MKSEDLIVLVQDIVKQACELKNKHTNQVNAPVNYTCIFSQSELEYNTLISTAKKIGTIIKETATGPLFRIQPITTVSGKLKLLKIRYPDKTRPERGDADFTVSNYSEFKKKYLPKKGFKLISRDNWEMIELMDSESDVRVYFSHPPLDVQLGIR